MLFYLFLFTMSNVFIYYGVKLKNKALGNVLSMVGILILSLAGGFRGIKVGTDTNFYVYHLFDLATYSDNFDFFKTFSKSYYDCSDYSYLLLTYIIAKKFNNFNIFLFIVEILIVYPIFKTLKINNKNNSNNIAFGMIIFCLAFYNSTFNMVRQSLALSFLLLSLSYYMKDNTKLKDYIISLLLLIIAIGFHSTCLISLIIYFTYFILKKKRIKLIYKKLLIFIIFLFTLIIVLNYTKIIKILYNKGIYEHGILYLENYQNVDFSFVDNFLYISILYLIISKKNIFKLNNEKYLIYVLIAIEGLLLLEIGTFIQYAERLSFYFLYPSVLIALPQTIENKIKSQRSFIIIFVVIVYWLYKIAFLNSHNTIPYYFQLY